MANNKKSRKIDKETRKIIEAVSDLVKKKKDDDGFKIKAKKKQAKKIKMTCPHWIIHKKKETHTVKVNPENNSEWICKICGKSFPISPYDDEKYDAICAEFLTIVDQAFFYSIRLGGCAEDTVVFENLKKYVPRFNKIVKNEMKILRKHLTVADNSNGKNDLNQFNGYGALDFHV